MTGRDRASRLRSPAHAQGPSDYAEIHYAVREKYDSLVFDRRLRGPDVMKRVLGVGHPVVDTAVSEALDLDVRVAEVVGLTGPLLVVSVEDQVTGTGSPAHRLILGVRENNGERQVLRDWELLRTLNERGSRVTGGELSPVAWTAPSLSSLVDGWVREVDAAGAGRAAGMQLPVSWPEMLLLPSRIPDR